MATAPPRHSPLARLAAGYWVESRRPLASLGFISPLLIVYEMGVLLLGPQAVRNGADAWLRQLLDWMGFGQYFLLPLLIICILLAWHYSVRQPWKISSGLLSGMFVECLLLAFCLRLILQLQGTIMHSMAGALPTSVEAASLLSISSVTRNLVGFLGAGIYEELAFRLILLSVLAWLVRRMGATPRPSLVLAVLLSSLIFAVAHYVGQYGDPVDWADSRFWFGFVFRCVAGVFFSVLFIYRGFGIAAGTHAGYDILVGLS